MLEPRTTDMRITRLSLVVLFGAALQLAAPSAQTFIGPGGEPLQLPAGRQNKTGTARIKGRLTTGDTGAAVRRAAVRLSGPEILPKSATTDNEGNFEFRDLPAGRFTITATKSGFVTVGYGQLRPFESPKTIELRDGELLDKADITMPRGSVISGRIIDEFGEPVADAMVSAMRSTWSNGRRRLQPTGRTATTNDLGQYRIYGLPPGEYFVSATLRGMQEMMFTEMAVAAAVRVVGTDSSAETPKSGYAPTYYPGTANGGEAQKLALALGQEIQNTDFALVPVRLARISGTVIGSDGRPLEGVMVSAMPKTAGVGAFIFPSGGGARTDRSGNFTMNGVAPGDYTLNARTSTIMSSSSEGGDRMVFTMTRVAGGPGGENQSEFGSVPISVNGEDMTNVMIATSRGTSVSGRVTYEGGSKPSANTLRISAADAESDGPIGFLMGSSSVTAEGTFEIKGVIGHRVIRVSNVPAGWVLKSVRLSGTDVTDTGVDVRTEPVTGLEVVLTNKVTEVNGSVKAGNDSAPDYTVVIFSDDPQKWTVPTGRYIASARPNQEGRFQVRNLPAGSYYAVALEYIPTGDWNDPDVLERLKSKATRVTLEEGRPETLTLSLETM
jgi:protocatechuate 3,4-dioxygenase beta subunit